MKKWIWPIGILVVALLGALTFLAPAIAEVAWIAAAILGGLGVLFGVLLGAASQKFAVPKDERAEAVLALLPGANCGGCGYSGCSGYAQACANGTASILQCAVMSQESRQEIGKLLGVVVTETEKKVAYVACRGTEEACRARFVYDGIADCAAAAATAQGQKACRFACLGMGTCMQVCPTRAIRIEDGIAEIDPVLCIGCGACVRVCPREVLHLTTQKPRVLCSNPERGKAVRDQCATGCIGCGLCAKVCPSEAITMREGLAIIDPERCTNCGQCMAKCPTNAIGV